MKDIELTTIVHYLPAVDKMGGIEMYILNLYAGLDKTKYKFVVLTRFVTEQSSFAGKLKNAGIDIISLGVGLIRMPHRMVEFYIKLDKFFQDNYRKIQCVHLQHIEEPFVADLAQKYNVPVIGHAHAVDNEGNNVVRNFLHNKI